MTRERQLLVWCIGFIVAGLMLHVLFGMLLPFVMGMAIAYFLDPVADKLESFGLSRGLATTVILLSFFVVLIGALIILIPLLGNQISVLIALVPDLVEGARALAEPYFEQLKADIPDDTLDSIRENMAGVAQNLTKSLTSVLSHVWSGGLAFFNALSLIVVTPIVAFYLLRDWDLITAKIDTWLPRREAEVIREQCLKIDKTLAAFVRGQALVCLVLALFYGICLSLVELKSGLLVGLGAGLISFVPYIGAAIGLGVGLAIALFQFSDMAPIALVVIIFLLGQTVESYFLTPRLVGKSVGY